MENESFNIFLGEKLRDKNISLERLAELSGISIKHLENMLKGDPEKLPSAPYLRGYFIKLGVILDFDGEALWKEWGQKGEMKSSGAGDRLPKNRFTRKSVAKYIWLSLVLLVFFSYGIVQFSRIFGTPLLYVAEPKTEFATAATDRITVSGTLQNAKKLYINGEDIPINADGSWQKSVLLQSGLNTLQIAAKKFLGRETIVIRQIFYTPPQTSTGTPAKI